MYHLTSTLLFFHGNLSAHPRYRNPKPSCRKDRTKANVGRNRGQKPGKLKLSIDFHRFPLTFHWLSLSFDKIIYLASFFAQENLCALPAKKHKWHERLHMKSQCLTNHWTSDSNRNWINSNINIHHLQHNVIVNNWTDALWVSPQISGNSMANLGKL